MKPVALVERAIRNSSPRVELVLDRFGGSGTTLIAAERAGRSGGRRRCWNSIYIDLIAGTRRRGAMPSWRTMAGTSRR
jgi:ribosomal protein S7